MNLYGNDMDEGVSPLDAGLAWTVDLKDAARIHRASSRWSVHWGTRWHLVGLKLLDRGVLRSHQKVVTKAGEGEVTSGTFLADAANIDRDGACAARSQGRRSR